jgi:hypothetical protein
VRVLSKISITGLLLVNSAAIAVGFAHQNGRILYLGFLLGIVGTAVSGLFKEKRLWPFDEGIRVAWPFTVFGLFAVVGAAAGWSSIRTAGHIWPLASIFTVILVTGVVGKLRGWWE